MKGKIELTSESGHGSLFKITWPCSNQKSQLSEEEKAVESSEM